MTKTKLNKIELSVFRGATKPVAIEFSPDKKLTMIFGENGTGKSSIVDAFDFICAQNFGSLEDRSGADKDLLASIPGKLEDLRVRLVTQRGEWSAACKGKSKHIEVKPPTGCPDVRILRRANILRLIEAQPNKRFEALQEYLDVQQIEKCEKSLGEAIRQKTDELGRYTTGFLQAQQSLEVQWKAEQSPGKSAEAWAKGEAVKDLSKLKAELAAAGSLVTSLSELEILQTACDTAASALSEAKTAHEKAETTQKSEEAKIVGQDGDLLELLQKARDMVAAKNPATCPVCQKPATAAHLVKELDERMATMKALEAAVKNAKATKRTFESASTTSANAEKAFLAKLAAVLPDVKTSSLEPATNLCLPAEHCSVIEDATKDVTTKIASATILMPLLTGIKGPLTTSKDAAQKTINQHAGISTQLEHLQTNRANQEATDALIRKLKKIEEVVAVTRKSFVGTVLQGISAEVERLYCAIHPSENVGRIKLSLDQKYFGSLHLQGDFHSAKGIAPQSLFSESHLDTLGFCVFLALAKQYKTDDSIIILDDVFTSVDSAHLDRLIDLVHDEEQHFSQVIITTHYRPWRDRYRNHRAPGDKVHFVELRSWTLDLGIRIQGMKLDLAELKATLVATPFVRQTVASMAGVFLENVLEFMARVYRCRLPLNPQPGYTLRELSDCFSSKLLSSLTVQRLIIEKDSAGAETQVWKDFRLAPLIAKVKGLAAVRNQVGAHFNDLGSHCTDAEIEELAKVAIELGDALICAEGGDLPSRSNSGSYHEARSKKVRLHPFAEPK